MPRRRWTKWLTAWDRIEVRMETARQQVLNFSVQYLALIGDDWHPVVRFDTAHGKPHIDLLWPTAPKETRDLKGLDNRQALTYALNEIDRSWAGHRERYERDMDK